MKLLRKVTQTPRPWARRTAHEAPVADAMKPNITPRAPVNDAQAYGVEIQPANPEPGSWYWQVAYVHHLAPEENGGRHHICVDLRDPLLPDAAHPDGSRVLGARVRVTWQNSEQLISTARSTSEYTANFPMWKWQVCSVTALGFAEDCLVSDRVVGLHTGHPEESAGNTLFHHSFSITFVKVQAPEVIHTDSVIYGTLRAAAGRTLELLRNETPVATCVIGADQLFRFPDLGRGVYRGHIVGTQFYTPQIEVNGRDQAQLDLTLQLSESSVGGRVRNGAGSKVLLAHGDKTLTAQIVGPDETYRFTDLSAGQYTVLLPDIQLAAPVTLDGANSETLDLVAPLPGKPLRHYVLFGPAAAAHTATDLWLAHTYLLTFRPTFGISPQEAQSAGMVTIIADETAVSADVEAQLRSDGTAVQRITGSLDEMAQTLAQRITQGRAF